MRSTLILLLVMIGNLTFGMPGLTDEADSIAIERTPKEVLFCPPLSASAFERAERIRYITHKGTEADSLIKEYKDLSERTEDDLNVLYKISLYSNAHSLPPVYVGDKITYCNGKYFTTTRRFLELLDRACTNVGEVVKTSEVLTNTSSRDDVPRLKEYIRSQSYRFNDYIQEPLVLYIWYKVNYLGICSSILIKKGNSNDAEIPLEVEDIIKRIFMKEFKWQPRSRCMPSEWEILPLRLRMRENGVIN